MTHPEVVATETVWQGVCVCAGPVELLDKTDKIDYFREPGGAPCCLFTDLISHVSFETPVSRVPSEDHRTDHISGLPCDSDGYHSHEKALSIRKYTESVHEDSQVCNHRTPHAEQVPRGRHVDPADRPGDVHP